MNDIATLAPPLQTDLADVRRTAELFLKTAKVVEVRVLDAKIDEFAPLTRLSGFFDNVDALVTAVEKIRWGAVYITRNPVNLELFQRAPNRLVEATQGGCASNGDIVDLKWLAIDIDPERPSGIAATDEERQAATAKLKQIKEHLANAGWPEPVEADSGNGGYLFYSIDLPVGEKELVEKCLAALARQFDDERVHIDLNMAKPAQITRLFGTPNRKGVHTTERPHRMSKIVSVPTELRTVPKGQLIRLAGSVKEPKSREEGTERAPAKSGAGFDLERWIADHKLAVKGPTPWTDQNGKKGAKWVFAVCPWNKEHTNSSAFIIRFANGAITAGCHHNGCADKNWHALRDVVEPGWWQRGIAHNYVETPGGLLLRKHTHDGVVENPLSNFTARITADKLMDDGVETTRTLTIVAKVDGKTVTADVPIGEFNGMNWVTKILGSKAITYPGSLIRDHVRTAIQVLSDDVIECVQYQHTGWRLVDGAWVFLHGGGAIGPVGTHPLAEVALVRQLAPLDLQLPEDAEELKRAIMASLRFLELAPDRVTIPLYLAMLRSVLGDVRFSVHVSGRTGMGKTELAALMEQHFGPEFTAQHLPGSWSSTANALEALMFMAKDLLLVVDDYAPAGSIQDVQRMSREFERVARAVGNHAGRQRARPDGSVRPEKPPRCLLVSTGEDIPRTESILARMFVVEVEPGDVKWDELTEAQRAAAQGLYAIALAGYLQWMAGFYEDLKSKLQYDVLNMRAELTEVAQHRRIPEIAANLLAGFTPFTAFCVEKGALTEDDARALYERAKKALVEAAANQRRHQEFSDPVTRFFDLLRAALTSGRVHLAGTDGKAPANPSAWGWSMQPKGSDPFSKSEIKANGELVGWIDDDDLYLERNAAYRAVQVMASSQGESLAIKPQTLWKRFSERGLLKSTEQNRHHLTVRKMIEAVRREVLHLSAATVFETEAAQLSQE